ncbi:MULTISPECIES: vitamin K epoxide reductase family protein [unclassified Bifidobacterium]|uniref:vitamin K epoxide reductase family protein n=1 Tax=unclassified Bifidobacterium TaxID=2608897 RepID=UPI0011283514
MTGSARNGSSSSSSKASSESSTVDEAALDEAALDETFDAADRRPTGFRHGATWTYLIMLIASAVALIVSFVLSAETLELARHPGQQLSCDVNSVLSCSAVAQSWQAEIVKFAGLSYPNAFFGIAAESVFVTIAVIGLARVKVPKWFAACTWFGGLAALLYSYWLTTQSLFVIRALCPWCLALMFSTTIQFMALSHATATVQRLPGGASDRPRAFDTYYRLNYDLMVDVVWVVAIVAIILVKDGAAFLS